MVNTEKSKPTEDTKSKLAEDLVFKPVKIVKIKPSEDVALKQENDAELKPAKNVELKPEKNDELKSENDFVLKSVKDLDLKTAEDVESLKLVKDIEDMKSKLSELELKLSKVGLFRNFLKIGSIVNEDVVLIIHLPLAWGIWTLEFSSVISSRFLLLIFVP